LLTAQLLTHAVDMKVHLRTLGLSKSNKIPCTLHAIVLFVLSNFVMRVLAIHSFDASCRKLLLALAGVAAVVQPSSTAEQWVGPFLPVPQLMTTCEVQNVSGQHPVF
jgi:hypothetical protein